MALKTISSTGTTVAGAVDPLAKARPELVGQTAEQVEERPVPRPLGGSFALGTSKSFGSAGATVPPSPLSTEGRVPEQALPQGLPEVPLPQEVEGVEGLVSDPGLDLATEGATYGNIQTAAGTPWARPDAVRTVRDPRTGEFRFEEIGGQAHIDQQLAAIANEQQGLKAELASTDATNVGTRLRDAATHLSVAEGSSAARTLEGAFEQDNYNLNKDAERHATFDRYTDTPEKVSLGDYILRDLGAPPSKRSDLFAGKSEEEKTQMREGLAFISAVAPIAAMKYAGSQAAKNSALDRGDEEAVRQVAPKDVVSGMIGQISRMAHNASIPLSQRQIGELALYKFNNAVQQGFFQVNPLGDGQFEVVTTSAGTDLVNSSAGQLAGLLVEPEAKPGFSKVPHGRLLGGTQGVTSKSIGPAARAQAKRGKVSAAKSILQHVEEKSYEVPTEVIATQVQDVMAGFQGKPDPNDFTDTPVETPFSTSKFAKRNKVDAGAFAKALNEFEPQVSQVDTYNEMMDEREAFFKERGINLLEIGPGDGPLFDQYLKDLLENFPNDADVKHAKMVMQMRVDEMLKALDVARKDLADGGYSERRHTVSNGRYDRENGKYNPETSKYDRDYGNFTEQWSVDPSVASRPAAIQRLKDKFTAWNNVKARLGADFSLDFDAAFTPEEQTMMGFWVTSAVTADKLREFEEKVRGKSEYKSNLNRLPPLAILKIVLRDPGGLSRMLENNAKYGRAVLAFQSGAFEGMDPELAKTMVPQETIENFLADVDLGDFQSTVNPLLDAANVIADAQFNQVTTPGSQKVHRKTQLLGTVQMDGTQNGLALLSIPSGNHTAARNLFSAPHYTGGIGADGTINVSVNTLDDLRDMMVKDWNEYVLQVVPEKDRDQARDIQDFFDKVKKTEAKKFRDFFKGPLMEYGYSKDAGMFGNNIRDFIADLRRIPKHRQAVNDLLHAFSSDDGRGLDLLFKHMSNAMKRGLQKTVPDKFTQSMKRIGRMFGVMNQPFIIDGIVGDNWVMTPVEQRDIVAQGGRTLNEEFGIEDVEYEAAELLLLAPDAQSTSDLQQFDVGRQVLTKKALSPTHSKGEGMYFNRTTRRFESMGNYAGSTQGRQAAVLPTQNTDAALLTLTLLGLNYDRMTSGTKLAGFTGSSQTGGRIRQTPIPVYTIHDSIVTTYRGLFHYHNQYNNVAIPQVMNWYREKYVKEILKALDEGKRKAYEMLDQRRTVGIGDAGDLAGVGGLLDEYYDRYLNPETAPAYREKAIATWENGKQEYENKKAQMEKLFADAKALGYKPPGFFADVEPNEIKAEEMRSRQAVSSANAKKLIELAEEELLNVGTKKAASRRRAMESELSGNVKRVMDQVKAINTAHEGLNQMSM